MAEFAPRALKDLFAMIDKAIPSAVNSGIVGDARHTSGYHRSRNRLIALGKTGDYSIQAAADKRGHGDACAGLDVSFPPAEMKLVTRRLMKACRDKDPRVNALREFLGTLDGRTVTGYNRVATGSGTRSKVGRISGDRSHLWHVHFSILRKFANDTAAVKAIGAVVTGLPQPAPEPAKIAIDGKEHDDITSVSVGIVNDARDTGGFSRHVYYVQLWLAKAPGASSIEGAETALPNRQGFWDAVTQAEFNAFRKSLGWGGDDAIGAVCLTSLSALAKKARSSKPVRV